MKIDVTTVPCQLCHQSFNSTDMTAHLQNCIPQHLGEVNTVEHGFPARFFHIQVVGYHAPQYWLQLGIRTDANFEELDQFLRHIWLECCGHRSAFFLHDEAIDMSEKIGDIFKHGSELFYQYDFNDTTELMIKVYKPHLGSLQKAVQVFARNNLPAISCDACGVGAAIQICQECDSENVGWLCNPCISEHECHERRMLPIVNSPRAGACKYTGDYR